MIRTSANAWIIDNAARLRQRLGIHLDEDAFQDAYLMLAQEHPSPEAVSILEDAFLNAYRRLRNRNIGEGCAHLRYSALVCWLMPSEEGQPMEKHEEAKDSAPLAKRVQRYIRASFPRKEVMAFEMRVKGFSCRDIADAIGIGTKAINSATERIIAHTRSRFAAVAP